MEKKIPLAVFASAWNRSSSIVVVALLIASCVYVHTSGLAVEEEEEEFEIGDAHVMNGLSLEGSLLSSGGFGYC